MVKQPLLLTDSRPLSSLNWFTPRHIFHTHGIEGIRPLGVGRSKSGMWHNIEDSGAWGVGLAQIAQAEFGYQ